MLTCRNDLIGSQKDQEKNIPYLAEKIRIDVSEPRP